MPEVARIDELAEILRKAYVGPPVPPIREELAEAGIEGAYAVQEHNTAFWVAEGKRVVGRKIGLTSPAVQRQLGVDQPDFGTLFADMCLADGEAIPAGSVSQPRVEAEVALVLSKDLDREDAAIHELVSAIDFVLPAIEVVGSRILNWDISILDTIADNASCGMFVLGSTPTKPGDVDLLSAGMVLELDGAVVSVGSGAACLGHPYRAALWLARRMAGAGSPLRAGDVVMTGALGPMVDLPDGASVRATIQGLGSVRLGSEGAS